MITVYKSIGALKEIMPKLLKSAQVMEIALNMQKTQYMEVTKKKQQILIC